MSNSNLVTHVNLSPNCNSPRNNDIRKITIHHQAGFQSVEELGKSFARESRGASSNYGIDNNGNVGMYVEECDRSWCSSSASNDNQAVTIEVANDGGAETGWHVSDTAMSKLVDLCVDICQRNGIQALNFTGDIDGNLTMHRYFAPTACPGPYLASQFPNIVAAVNARLNGEEVQSQSSEEPLHTFDDVVNAVIRGDYGNGQERIDRLTAEGYNPDDIQEKVNEYYNGTSVEEQRVEPEVEPTPDPEPDDSDAEQDLSEVVNAVIRGDYGNGQERFDKLSSEGYNPDEIQSMVNEACGSEDQAPEQDLTQVVDEVIRGYYGNGQERIDRLTAEGYDVDKVQALVNERFA